MYEFDYISALKEATPDQIAKHLSEQTGFDYDSAIQSGATPDQINNHLFESGQVLQYQKKPDWWGDFTPEEQNKIQSSMVGYNRNNPDNPISYKDIPDRSGVLGVIKEFGSGVKSGITDRLPQDFARMLRNAFSEYDPTDEDSTIDKFISEQSKDMRSEIPSAQRMADKSLQTGAYEGGSSVPTSVATMAPGVAAGLINPALGVAVSTGLSGAGFYGVAKDQFLEDIGNAFISKTGRRPTDEEWKTIYENVESAAVQSGLWEGGTEAAGALFSQLLFMTPIGKQIGKIFADAPGIKGSVGRFVGKSFLDYGEEVTGETIAEKKQSDLRQQVGLSDSSKTYGEAFKDVAIPTAFATGVQAGGLHGISSFSEIADALAKGDDEAINTEFENIQKEQAGLSDIQKVRERNQEIIDQTMPAEGQTRDEDRRKLNQAILDNFMPDEPGEGTVYKRPNLSKGTEAIPSEDMEDIESGGIQYSISEDIPTFYSALEKGVSEIKQESAPASQWTGIINKMPVKKEELEWIGLEDWLKEQKGKVSKQDIVDFVRANNVDVQEVEKGAGDFVFKQGFETQSDLMDSIDGDDQLQNKDGSLKDGLSVKRDDGGNWNLLDNQGQQTKFSKYQEPGGKNYKELLLTMPERKTTQWSALEALEIKLRSKYGNNFEFHELTHDEQSDYLSAKKAFYEIEGKRTTVDSYQSPHYDETNILAHVRFNERTDADGNRVLFLEEVQSYHSAEYRKQSKNIEKSVTDNFKQIVEKMESQGVLKEVC